MSSVRPAVPCYLQLTGAPTGVLMEGEKVLSVSTQSGRRDLNPGPHGPELCFSGGAYGRFFGISLSTGVEVVFRQPCNLQLL